MAGYHSLLVNKYASVAHAPRLTRVQTPSLDVKPEDWCSEELMQPGLFKDVAASLLMSALYSARMYRYDYLYQVTFLARLVSKWTILADRLLVRLFSYIMTTASMTMTGTIVERSFDDWTIDVFCDADLNGAPDTTKSTSGGLVRVVCPRGTSFVIEAWTKKQSTTALSTAEAEMTSLMTAVRDHCVPLQIIYASFRADGSYPPCIVHEDNSAVITVVKAGYSAQLRYLEKHKRCQVGYLNEVFAEPDMTLVFVETSSQLADPMTKSLPYHKLCTALKMLGFQHPHLT
jgi:hypothetical protein